MTKKKDQYSLIIMEKLHKFLAWLTMQENSCVDNNKEGGKFENKKGNLIGD